jgi:hypothetical protein
MAPLKWAALAVLNARQWPFGQRCSLGSKQSFIDARGWRLHSSPGWLHKHAFSRDCFLAMLVIELALYFPRFAAEACEGIR